MARAAAAEFFETADLTTATGTLSAEDVWLIAEHIEVSDAEIDDSWLPAETYEELMVETAEQHLANVQRVIQHETVGSRRYFHRTSINDPPHSAHEPKGSFEVGDER